MSRAEKRALAAVPSAHRDTLATVLGRMRLLQGIHSQPAEFRVIKMELPTVYECYAIGYPAPLTVEQMEHIEAQPSIDRVWVDFTVHDGVGGLCATVCIGGKRAIAADDDEDEDDNGRGAPRAPTEEENFSARKWISRLFG